MKTDDPVLQHNLVTLLYDRIKTVVAKFIEDRGLPKDAFTLIYKGGNVMRFVTKAFVTQQTSVATQMLEEAYADVFKPSDMDFGIVVDNACEKINETVVHKLSDRLFAMLKDLRSQWMSSDMVDDTFPFLHLSAAKKQQKLDALLRGLQDEAKNHDLPIDVERASALRFSSPDESFRTPFYTAAQRKDLTITFAKNENYGGRWVCEDSKPSSLYCSNNKSLRFSRREGRILHFDLVRMKLCVRVEGVRRHKEKRYRFGKLLGGEIIDISVSHRTQDVAITPPKFVDLNGEKVIKYQGYTYQNGSYKCIRQEDGSCSQFSFMSYSIPFLVVDLIKILFYDSKFAYEDEKYAKRVKRISALLLCNGMTERLGWGKVLEAFEGMIINVDEALQEETMDDFSADLYHHPIDDPDKVVNIYVFTREHFAVYARYVKCDETGGKIRSVVETYNHNTRENPR
jgi:hypothetical protein